MLRPCINYVSTNTKLPIDEQIRLFHDAGFECVDFNIDMFLPNSQIESGEFSDFFKRDIPEILESIRPYKESFEKYGIEVTQAHAPYQLYVDGNDEINEFCYEVIEKCLAICQYLGCRYIVIHPLNLAFRHDREYERQKNMEYYTRCIPFCKKYGVMICLENMFTSFNKHITEAVCSDCSETVRYIDSLNERAGEDCFGFCFDLGHMTLLGKHIRESLVTLGSRVKLVHIHDNDGIQDHHGLPWVYTRNWGQMTVTDWNGFLEGLRKIRYRGELDFEVSSGCRLLPDGLIKAGMTYTYSVGKYFAEQILK